MRQHAEHADGPLEPPEFDDALDDPKGVAPLGRSTVCSGESAGMTEEPDAEAAAALFSVAVPDR